MCFQVAEERALGTAKRKERHRGRYADVDADHADAHAIAKLARRLAALREDRGRIREARTLHHLDAFVEIADVRDRRDRPEDLLSANGHVGLHPVEHGGTDEVAARLILDLCRGTVEQHRRPSLAPRLDGGEYAFVVLR